MITFLVILGFVLLILSWLLFGPVIIRIDTSDQDYSITIPLVFRAQLDFSGGEKRLLLRVFFIPFSASLEKFPVKGIDTVIMDKSGLKIPVFSSLRKAPGTLALYYKNARDIMQTFRLRHLIINFDTGDHCLNARLIPVVLLASRQNLRISVNFIEENSLLLVLQNRLYRLLWHGIKFYFKLRKT